MGSNSLFTHNRSAGTELYKHTFHSPQIPQGIWRRSTNTRVNLFQIIYSKGNSRWQQRVTFFHPLAWSENQVSGRNLSSESPHRPRDKHATILSCGQWRVLSRGLCVFWQETLQKLLSKDSPILWGQTGKQAPAARHPDHTGSSIWVSYPVFQYQNVPVHRFPAKTFEGTWVWRSRRVPADWVSTSQRLLRLFTVLPKASMWALRKKAHRTWSWGTWKDRDLRKFHRTLAAAVALGSWAGRAVTILSFGPNVSRALLSTMLGFQCVSCSWKVCVITVLCWSLQARP